MAKPKRDEENLDGFAGLNELINPFDLGKDEENNWLVKADNVDIDDGGTVKVRPGTSKIASYTSPHSLWSDGDKALFSAQGTLYRIDNINDSSVSATSIVTGAGGTRFGYAELDNKVYFSNQKKRGMLLDNGGFHTWEVEAPTNQPTLSTMTGALNIDHSISVFVTYIDDLGRESGSSGIATLRTDSETGVKLTNIPVPSDSNIEYKAIYCTPPDGDIFYLVEVIATNVTTYNITNFSHHTVQEETLFLSEPPLGSLVAEAAGRILVAKDEYLYMSMPLRYHLFNIREDHFKFPSKIDILAAVEDGVYVVADKTYFVPLNEESPSLIELLPYGAVPGTNVKLSGEDFGDTGIWAGWVGNRGYVIGGSGGRVRNITEKNTALSGGIEGGSFVRDDDGYSRIVATIKEGQQTEGLRATDYVTATITKCPAISTENTADNYYYTADITTITADAE